VNILEMLDGMGAGEEKSIGWRKLSPMLDYAGSGL
jgi:hypothetical protein